MKIADGRALIRIGIAAVVAAVLVMPMISMPGRSFEGPLPELTPRQAELADRLRRHVGALGGEIGERDLQRYPALVAAADYIGRELGGATGLPVKRDGYEVTGKLCENLEIALPGTGDAASVVVVGAHYDSAPGCPAANDNGTGVAALIELARSFSGRPQGRTVRFVAFANEEPPHFMTEQMGSWVYARRCRERGDRIAAMISLETMGYYSDEPGSQRYPFPMGLFYPGQGNFIGFVGNVRSIRLVRRTVDAFRKHASFPSEGAALPGTIPGVGWSDHWSFWQHGYRAVMVTDTAPFRYPHYHLPTDTPDKIDYERLARVVEGLEHVLSDLAQ
jgi:hypothetical protein